jgi:hypothetical protein
MRHKLFLITLSIITLLMFLSCTESVKFGISQKYYLNEKEKETFLDEYIVQKYKNIINVDTLKVPLNKFITSKNYRVYIGVSFSSDANNLYSFYKNDSLFSFIDNHINTDNISIFFKKGNAFFYSFIYDSQKDKYTYILTLESDSLTVNHIYYDDFLSKKIKNAQ